MKCPNCGAQSDGAFCSQCGAPLKGAQCRECQSPLATGARFCNNCGAATSRVSARGDHRLPWIVAGASLLIAIIVLAMPVLRGNSTNESDGRVPISQLDATMSGGQGAGPGPLEGTPRQQADRLFNRVMTERVNGDTARAKFFLPMAVQAYQMAGNLDADGYYHLSLLQQMAGDYQAALETAEKILATSPNHLLGLAAAADAARATGDNTTARQYYRRLLASYDAESKTARQEYADHGNTLPELRKQAQAFLEQ